MSIDKNSDVIDSREVIERIEELQGEREAFEHDDDGNRNGLDWASTHALEAEELAELEALAKQCEGASDWEHGEQLIAESYFTDYIEQLIDDCWELPKEMKSGEWPWRHMKLDYEAAADEAKADYDEVTFWGHTFLIRM